MCRNIKTLFNFDPPATDEDDGVRMDLRVDDSGDPVAQLRMLRNLQRAYDERDYEMLALFDALRVGKARERNMASKRLLALIDPDAPSPPKELLRG